MDASLDRRCALAILFAAMVAAAVALVAAGPVMIDPGEHRHADQRHVAGLPNGWNVLANLPVFAAGLLGLALERRLAAPPWLRRARQAFFGCVVAGAALAAAHHLDPGPLLFLLANAALAIAFLVVTAALLGERVHPVFAAWPVLAAALAAVAGATSASIGLGGDMRPLLWMQLVPLLVVPTGAITLQARETRASDWFVLLALYGVARLADLADDALFRATGWISGHTLMHLVLALAVLWLAYCAAAGRPVAASASTDSQRPTSLHTAG